MTTSAIGTTLLPVPPPQRVMVQEMTHKVCPHCGEDKPADAYYRKVWQDRRKAVTVARHALSSYCKDCTNAVSAAQQGTPAVRARRAAKARARRAEQTDAERLREREYLRSWYAAHQDERRAYARAHGRVYRARRKEEGRPLYTPPPTRRCRICAEERPREAFPSAHSCVCTACQEMRPERRRERNRAYYQRHQEARRAEQRALRVKRAEAAGLPTPAQRTWGYWTCPACKEAQPKASFTGRKGTPCDECRTHKAAAVVRLYATAAERQRAYYQEHREERLAYARAYAARRKQQAAQKEAQG